MEEIDRIFAVKSAQLEKSIETTVLPAEPRHAEIKQLLIDCLEAWFGSIDKMVATIAPSDRAMFDIKKVVDQWALSQ